jgi:N,N-dimethylformamidase
MTITGYTDNLSVEQGKTIKFMVNCEGYSKYTTNIVRLIHGDTNPAGPGFKAESVKAHVNGEYQGRAQPIWTGSYVIVPDNSILRELKSMSLQAMIFPTTPYKGVQGLLTKWSDAGQAGYGLFIDDKNCVSFWSGDGRGQVQKVSTGKPLIAKHWYFVGASFDASTGKVVVFQKPVVKKADGILIQPHALEAMSGHVERHIEILHQTYDHIPLIMAGYVKNIDRKTTIIDGLYNGKIDRPRMANVALTYEEMKLCLESPARKGIVAAWDFAAGGTPHGFSRPSDIIDISPNRMHGKAVNLPARAVTGYNWNGTEHNFIHAPEQYGAIHFHDDDLSDAKWEADFAFHVPDDFKSGVYAAHLIAGDGEEYIPFFVRPKKGMPTANIVWIAPTATYLAYANSRFQDVPISEVMFGRAPVVTGTDLFLEKHMEYGLSTYDVHSDGSGVCYSSALRPILTMRPKYRANISPSVWAFAADLHLIDWLTVKGYSFDVITDQDLHLEGVCILEPYKVALTGTHPEYSSGPMLDAIQAYQQIGGRVMYMGANGFYWVTQFHPENPNIIEVRKNYGSQAWRANPGELHLSFTGELGGLWRHVGRPPQTICGTGWASEGFDVSSYYRRNPDSFDPRVAWIFKGIGDDELLGDFGLVGGGAAGLELDICDSELGTPSHAFILASSENHSNVYMVVLEELYFNLSGVNGIEHPKVRADMVYYPTRNGGAVFSVSSIAYCGSLSHNNYNNNISTITQNVLDKFSSIAKYRERDPI